MLHIGEGIRMIQPGQGFVPDLLILGHVDFSALWALGVRITTWLSLTSAKPPST